MRVYVKRRIAFHRRTRLSRQRRVMTHFNLSAMVTNDYVQLIRHLQSTVAVVKQGRGQCQDKWVVITRVLYHTSTRVNVKFKPFRKGGEDHGRVVLILVYCITTVQHFKAIQGHEDIIHCPVERLIQMNALEGLRFQTDLFMRLFPM